MQFRPDAGSGLGLSCRSGPSFPALLVRGGLPVDCDSRDNERRYSLHGVSWQQQHQQASLPKSSLGDDVEEVPPSRHLWVGNVSQEVTEGILEEKFGKFGSIESVTVYSQRNYAFINFRDLENARDAKNGLQGIVLGGLAMRIEFSKGARPSRHLWVGGIGQAVSREEIEGEFKRFGKMEDFKFLRERNCAFIDYEKTEDAFAAVESLNRKCLGDEELRVDFGRSQPPKRDIAGRPSTASAHEEWGRSHGRDGRDHAEQIRIPAEHCRGHSDVKHSERGACGDSFYGPSDKYQASSAPGTAVAMSGRSRGEKEEPSDVLWVGFPLLSKVDEEGLRKAFVAYGDIERVKTFPGRTYAFVQFKSVEEASRAKTALEGKLFNDPRVHIRFSNSEIGPVDNPRSESNAFPPSQSKDAQGLSERITGRLATSDRLGIAVPPFRSTGLRPEYFPGGLSRGAAVARTVGTGSVTGMRRGVCLGPGSMDERIAMDKRDDQTRSHIGHGLTGTVAGPGGRLPLEEKRGSMDDDIMGRESKRLRILHGGGADSLCHSIYQGVGRHSGLDNLYGGSDPGRDTGNGVPSSSRTTGNLDEYSHVSGASRAHIGSLHFEQLRQGTARQGPTIPISAVGIGPTDGFTAPLKKEGFGGDGGATGVNERWRWHGTIAKGGTPVCRARCLPVGKGIDITVPDVVNCTARTDLDMLAKHVYQAGDFGVVFFVPETDPDVPPYHDFMYYLGEKHRAGVAKLVDGTTLFLVPPSEFSERVLKVPGNNCLFGVVLKAQQPSPAGLAPHQQQEKPAPQQHQLLLAPAPQQQHILPQAQPASHQKLVSQEQQHLHSRALTSAHGSLNGDNGGAFSSPTAQKGQSPPSVNGATAQAHSQFMGLAGGFPTVLTPELIASLTAFLPSQMQSPARSDMRGTNLSILPPSSRDGIISSSGMSRLAPISGFTLPSLATTDSRTSYRSPQIHQQPIGQSQIWPPQQADQLSSNGGQLSVPPEQGSTTYGSSPKQPQVAPTVPIAQTHALLSSSPRQVLSGPGYLGQQSAHNPSLPQHPALQLEGAPLLPSDQLAQLTALLTQRQHLPVQLQQAAQLPQQNYQLQQPVQSQRLVNSLQRPLSPSCHHQAQHQQYIQRPFSQQQGPQQGSLLAHHVPQLMGHPQIGGTWDGVMMEGQQSQAVLQQPPSTQQHIPQFVSGGVVPGERVGGISQDDAERQKRFQATLQLAAALLQQMQHQQSSGQGNSEQ